GCAERPAASPTRARATSPAGSTCRLPTCSSTACPRPASACCASWNAKASSGPRCCGGCRATSTPILRLWPLSAPLAPLPDGGALLGEGAGALLGVLGAEDRGHERGHLVPSLLGGPVAAP